ncbi:MAG TPA: 3-dehydroquinate synthase [Solirubrobacterales bacterium]|jgi:shikimate kinase/3-dehydroquinate synthase|nr:3-dehydroquinate synthase [Solirubrobacterales bacterium]
MSRHLVLTGFMGAGKSSAASRIASTLERECFDTDAMLESRLRMSIPDYFAKHGEAAFREQEQTVIAEVLATKPPAVVSLGGGALESPATRKAIAKHLVVYLELEAEIAWRRVQGSRRPLAQNRREFFDLFEKRRAVYEDTATVIVRNAPRGAIRDALPCIEQLLERKRGPRMIWTTGKGWGYPAIFDTGALSRRDIWIANPDSVTVSDENLARTYKWLRDGVVVAAGETAKTLEQVEYVTSQLAEMEFQRGRQIAAVGGGVVGDLAGFAASVYQRGTPFVQVPTTLVAQVDSAYGGKTGVDLPAAKNYVGAYHQPDAVLTDTDALASLPKAELISGFAEVIKTALIAGGRLWDVVSQGVDLTQPLDPWIVFESARTKLRIVAADERDENLRQILNLGHTIGHAIESAAGYGTLRHGEAVSIGMAGALRLSGNEALRDQVIEISRAAGLPVTVEGVDIDDVLARVKLDKKRHGDSVPFVLVSAPGRVTPGHTVSDTDLRLAVEELIE